MLSLYTNDIDQSIRYYKFELRDNGNGLSSKLKDCCIKEQFNYDLLYFLIDYGYLDPNLSYQNFIELILKNKGCIK